MLCMSAVATCVPALTHQPRMNGRHQIKNFSRSNFQVMCVNQLQIGPTQQQHSLSTGRKEYVSQQDAVTDSRCPLSQIRVAAHVAIPVAEWAHGYDSISILEHGWFTDQYICGHASAENNLASAAPRNRFPEEARMRSHGLRNTVIATLIPPLQVSGRNLLQSTHCA